MEKVFSRPGENGFRYANSGTLYVRLRAVFGKNYSLISCNNFHWNFVNKRANEGGERTSELYGKLIRMRRRREKKERKLLTCKSSVEMGKFYWFSSSHFPLSLLILYPATEGNFHQRWMSTSTTIDSCLMIPLLTWMDFYFSRLFVEFFCSVFVVKSWLWCTFFLLFAGGVRKSLENI